MCGIAGILGRAATPGAVTRMLAAQAHRGPDGEGLWSETSVRVVLGHRRLAVIDPRAGMQPMANEDGSVQITFNGCIYNHCELADELRARGHRFASQCDTEVIVHAYEEWGTDCVQRFNGMWAFGLWDSRKRVLFCSRDRMGVKPFYYTWDGETFAFASEIKALLAAGLVNAARDEESLRQYLTFQFCLGARTLFRDVKKLEPGHELCVAPEGAPRVRQYWRLDYQLDEEHNEQYFTGRLRELLQDSVRLRLRSDVPIGAHLSGGIDSSTIVGLARREQPGTPLATFTGAFHEPGFDETEYARTVARAHRTDHHEIYLGPKHFADSIEKILYHLDEPCAGPGAFPQFCVSRLASQRVKVVLGGQGGDELFVGYARYLVAYLEESLRGAIEASPDSGRHALTLATIVPNLSTLKNYMPMLKNLWRGGLFDDPARSYFRLMDRFADSQPLLNPGFQGRHEQTLEEFATVFNGAGTSASLINRILHFDLKTQLQALLQVEDRASMAFGIESRTPLLDYRLVELVSSIPPVIKFKNGRLKHLFLKVARDFIPRKIHQRQDKMGFPVPLNQWLAGPLRDLAGDVLLSRAARERGIWNTAAFEQQLANAQPYSRGLWGALSLELWHRTFLDQPLRVSTLAAA